MDPACRLGFEEVVTTLRIFLALPLYHLPIFFISLTFIEIDVDAESGFVLLSGFNLSEVSTAYCSFGNDLLMVW